MKSFPLLLVVSALALGACDARGRRRGNARVAKEQESDGLDSDGVNHRQGRE